MAKSSVVSARAGQGVATIMDVAKASASAAAAARRRSSAAMPAPSMATMTASIRNNASAPDSSIPLRSRGSALV